MVVYISGYKLVQKILMVILRSKFQAKVSTIFDVIGT